MWQYRASLIEVSDGDTVRLLVDCGFSARMQVDVRLLDVWAPELADAVGGLAAKQFVELWFGAHWLRKTWPVMVQTQITKAVEPTQRRSFVRYIGEIWPVDGGVTLNERLRAYLGGVFGDT